MTRRSLMRCIRRHARKIVAGVEVEKHERLLNEDLRHLDLLERERCRRTR